ncbi:hypothetical protein GCM10023340_15180 [Nocardioides marinquilinus]|uniref:DUF1080 domain-containing protein n=1 Tax=Nocardioides marinquilinus TaxID=1210400 RepID=A0ABP9PJZ5_9ACTN
MARVSAPTIAPRSRRWSLPTFVIAALMLFGALGVPTAQAAENDPSGVPSPAPEAVATEEPAEESDDADDSEGARHGDHADHADHDASGQQAAAAADPPDLDTFQKVVLGQGSALGEVMELTVAEDGRVFFITRAGDISLYDPADGSIEIVMNNTQLQVWSGLEDGGLGITLDPAFDDNGWMYVYYAPLPANHNANRLARLTVTEDADGDVSIAKASEKVILEVGTQRNVCCHSAGSLQFGQDGVLHLATGDNTSSSFNDGYSPHDERTGRSDYDAQKSSGNTNDLRGKILRVVPRDDDAGDVNPTPNDGISYDIPAGNLFGEGGAYASALYPNADAAKTRPEIYVMGLRNPYRLGVDPDTDALYWGEVGPDARSNNPGRGPRHQEEFNRTEVAMNGGWPYCGGEVGDDLTAQGFGGAYVDWDFTANKARTNTDGTLKRFPCNNPSGMPATNDSPNSTGLVDLPPMTDAWIPYSTSAPWKYPEVEGSTPTGAQVYRQSQNTSAASTAFPEYYEGSVFISEMSRGWIKEVRIDQSGAIQSINDFMGGFYAPGDMEFGPDGSLYVLEYGSGFFSGSPDTKLVRIDYAIDGQAPRAVATADPGEGGTPLTVQFSSAGTTDPDGDALTYAWDFDGDGQPDATTADASWTYDRAGDYSAVLTVTDATGKSATAQVVVTVGNTRPKVDLVAPIDGGFFTAGDDIAFDIDVTDGEETVDCDRVEFSHGLGHDIHAHPLTSTTGCEGVLTSSTDTDHGPDANVYGVFAAKYSDLGGNGGANGPLTGEDRIILQPKLRQAEHSTSRQGIGQTGYDDKSGTRPGAGGILTGMGNGDWFQYSPMSLANMTEVAFTYSGGPQDGAAIEVRAGSATGPVAARIPLSGGTEGLYYYKTSTGAVASRAADQGGRGLYFVYTGGGEINPDEVRFTGTGVAANVAPTITSVTATPADGTAPLETRFVAEATDPDGGAVSYAWDFGVAGTTDDVATGATPTYTYTQPGRYTATVTATDPTAKSSTRSVDVVVRRACATPPVADAGYELLFDGNRLDGWSHSGPGGFTVEDCAMTSVGGLGLLWYDEQQFADYSLKVQFKLSDEGDNSGVFTRFPDPGDDPFNAVDEGHEIQIKEGQPGDEPQKTGSVYNFDREDARNAKPVGEWNDYEIRVVGQKYVMTLNGQVVNTYVSDGSRGITGFVGLQNHGNADTVSFRNIQIKELDVPEPFVNTVSVDPTRGGAPLEVTFEAEGVDRQGDAITYDWDFGDGSDVVTGAGATVEHTYTAKGSYTATVTPVDAAGNRGASVEADEVTVLTDPVPTAGATPSCGLAPLVVAFSGSATDPQGQSVTYAWDFGVEGTTDDTSTQEDPSYTYSAPGSYTATLTVTDPDGNTGTTTTAVRVLADGECRSVADLDPFFNNDGISTHGSPGDGDFDGGGWSFAAETLPEQVRADGGSLVVEGVDYELGSPADGQQNNVEADGQTIPLPSGRFELLNVLGSSHNGDVEKDVTVTYADGTSSTHTLRFTDWAAAPKFGETVAVAMPHRHDRNGDTGPSVALWAQSLPITPSKDVVSVTLPDDDHLHVFAISLSAQEVEPPCNGQRSDDFDDGELLDNCHWRVRRPDTSLYSVGDGQLTLRAGPGEYSSAPNLITQAAPEGPWTATTKVVFDPTQEGQQAGMVVAGAGGSGFAKLQFVRKSNGGNEWIEFLKSSNPNNSFDFSGNWHTGGGDFAGPFLPTDFPTTFWLRLASDGTQLKGYYSTDGEDFVQVGDARAIAGIDSPRVGLMSLRGAAAQVPVADYDWFRMTQPSDPEPGVWVVDAVDGSTSQWVAEATGTSSVTIPVGDTVEWQFDQATMSHDLTSTEPTGGAKWNPKVQEYRDPRGAPFRYTFTQPGTYHYVCVIHGATMTGTVVVKAPNQAPTASPMVDPTTGPPGLYVHFEARATDPDGDPLSYRWDFGDGSPVETADHAHHTYANPGRYFATLEVSDGNGGQLQREFPITVTGGQGPLVTANLSPRSGDTPLNVVGQGSATDPQGDDMTYRWDFGVPDVDDDVFDTTRASYTYRRPGTYTATYTATDSAGNTGVKTFRVVVGGDDPGPEPDPVPAIAATATPADGEAPLDVQFSTEVTTTGEFTEFASGAGVYDISGTATMTRRHGSTTTSLDVTGLPPGSMHMVHVHEQACGDQNGGAHFRFDDTAPFGEENEIWLHIDSDGTGASGLIEVEDPQRAGEKAVSMVIHGPNMGAERIACADFTPSTSGLTYAWDFGDGETGTGPDPQHVYDEPGTYTATVEVAAETGTPATAEVEVVVAETADTVAPQTTVTGGPSGTVKARSATFRLGSSEPGSTWQCRLDGKAWAACTSPVRLSALRDGRHELRVRAVDAAGNADATPVSRRWTVDTTGPSVTAVSPRGTTRDRTPTIRATVRDAHSAVKRASTQLRVDGKLVRGLRWQAAQGRLTWTPSTAMAVGRHTVRLVVVDALGNRTVREWRFTVRR